MDREHTITYEDFDEDELPTDPCVVPPLSKVRGEAKERMRHFFRQLRTRLQQKDNSFE